MTYLPIRLRPIGDRRALVVNDAGRFFAGSEQFLGRLTAGTLTDGDNRFLRDGGHAIEDRDELGLAAHKRGVAERIVHSGDLDYLILVPTLRCNLSCSYCQVSRVAETRTGFDWSSETFAAVLTMIDGLPANRVKIEFQGGEPTLRPDLIRGVIERCARFQKAEFVICTNLQALDPEVLELFDRPDVFISTSLDGDAPTHSRYRTVRNDTTATFINNLHLVMGRYGPGKVSALPTIDPADPPSIDGLIDAYANLGLDSIFLRPINYQGFARKRHGGAREQDDAWRAYYERFVMKMIERNWSDRSHVIEETYLSIVLRRIFRPNTERHVDLRNPNPMGIDYLVVDHDGTLYPTDEARMLARSGVIDLSIGDVRSGIDLSKRDLLNRYVTNQFDPACSRCAYQPFCGRDVVDDISRYGRINLPRQETAFCRRHMHLFDLAFRLIYSADDSVRHSLSRWLRLPGTPAAFGTVIE